MSLPMVKKIWLRMTVAITGAAFCSFVVPVTHANGLTHRLWVSAQGGEGQHRAAAPVGRRSMSALPNVFDIAARLMPTVVHINVSGSKSVSIMGEAACGEDSDTDDLQDAALLKKRLRQLQKQFGIVPPVLNVPVQSDGSGVIVRSDGIIMTNAHVVEAAEAISVKLSDRREYRARLVGMDPLTDIALLKIDVKDLPVAKLAQVLPRGPGDWVVALGSPFGLAHSVTAGVISATGRFFPGEEFVPFIQSDAAVNPGSSGGPLVNMRGEVIGINSSFMSRSKNSQGVSFAIPIDLAWKIGQKILRDGHVRHAQLGIAIQDLSEPLAKSFNLEKPAGAVIIEVADESTAEKAGLEVGDVILTADGKEINVSGEIAVHLIMANPGQTMVLGVWHQGAMREVRVPLDAASEASGRDELRNSPAQQEIASLGLVISPLEPGSQGSVTKNAGVLVRSVTGAALHAGVRAGDVLLALNATPIRHPDDAVKTAASTGGYMAALIQHGREKRYVPLYRGE